MAYDEHFKEEYLYWWCVCKPHCEQSCLCFSKDRAACVSSIAVIFEQTTRIPVRIPFQTPFQTDPDPIQNKIS